MFKGNLRFLGVSLLLVTVFLCQGTSFAQKRRLRNRFKDPLKSSGQSNDAFKKLSQYHHQRLNQNNISSQKRLPISPMFVSLSTLSLSQGNQWQQKMKYAVNPGFNRLAEIQTQGSKTNRPQFVKLDPIKPVDQNKENQIIFQVKNKLETPKPMNKDFGKIDSNTYSRGTSINRNFSNLADVKINSQLTSKISKLSDTSNLLRQTNPAFNRLRETYRIDSSIQPEFTKLAKESTLNTKTSPAFEKLSKTSISSDSLNQEFKQLSEISQPKTKSNQDFQLANAPTLNTTTSQAFERLAKTDRVNPSVNPEFLRLAKLSELDSSLSPQMIRLQKELTLKTIVSPQLARLSELSEINLTIDPEFAKLKNRVTISTSFSPEFRRLAVIPANVSKEFSSAFKQLSELSAIEVASAPLIYSQPKKDGRPRYSSSRQLQYVSLTPLQSTGVPINLLTPKAQIELSLDDSVMEQQNLYSSLFALDPILTSDTTVTEDIANRYIYSTQTELLNTLRKGNDALKLNQDSPIGSLSGAAAN